MGDSNATADDRQKAAAAFHRRNVQWLVMFVLPLLAVALAVPPKRATSAIGVFLSVVILVTYHKISEYGERMGAIGRVDPMLAQWVPFLLFCGLCGWFYHVLAHRPGGQPIGALDRVFKKLGGLFKGLRKPAARIGLVPEALDEPAVQAAE
jgi:lipopolysaccharide export system permease protein